MRAELETLIKGINLSSALLLALVIDPTNPMITKSVIFHKHYHNIQNCSHYVIQSVLIATVLSKQS